MIDLGQYDAIKSELKTQTNNFRVTDANGYLIKGNLTQDEAIRIVIHSQADLYVRKAA